MLLVFYLIFSVFLLKYFIFPLPENEIYSTGNIAQLTTFCKYRKVLKKGFTA